MRIYERDGRVRLNGAKGAYETPIETHGICCAFCASLILSSSGLHSGCYAPAKRTRDRERELFNKRMGRGVLAEDWETRCRHRILKIGYDFNGPTRFLKWQRAIANRRYKPVVDYTKIR